MKKSLLILTVCCLSANTYANLIGDGYYRVKNYGSQRWASLIDDQCEIDMEATNADLHAMKLTLNYDEILPDPGSIIYIRSLGGNKYDVAAQGTSVEELMGYSVSIAPDGTAPDGQTLYRLYGVYKGVTKYIGDKIMTNTTEGFATISPLTNPDFVRWCIIPVDVQSDNYLGTLPTVNINGYNYNTLFASFSYKPFNPGMKAYYIGRTGDGIAEMIEIINDVPAKTPVIIECNGVNVADNKLEITSNPATITGNTLEGVYFDFYYSKNLQNRVLYDPATMRVLGKCSDGSLGFITSPDLVSIPANSAYLKVEEGSPAEFKCVTPEEFTASVQSLISTDSNIRYKNGHLISDGNDQITVLSMAGQTVAKGSGSLNVQNLPKGVYLAKSGNKILKFMVN